MTQYVRRRQNGTTPPTRRGGYVTDEKIYPEHQRPRRVERPARALPKPIYMYSYSMYACMKQPAGLFRNEELRPEHDSACCTAYTLDEALEMALDHALEIYPQEDGWEEHHVVARIVDEEFVKDLLENRGKWYEEG
jgi:hypothetical protein